MSDSAHDQGGCEFVEFDAESCAAWVSTVPVLAARTGSASLSAIEVSEHPHTASASCACLSEGFS